jgi:hypothetical protein
MTYQPPPCPDDPPEDNRMEKLPSAPEAERDLVGAMLYDELAFERANLKAADFFILRWRWFWEACEAIRAIDDHIDEGTLQKELLKSGHWLDVTAQYPLVHYYNPTLLHVEANARLVREMAERRRLLALYTEGARRACDLNIPLPPVPDPVKTHWTQEELAAAEFPEPEGPVPGLIPNGLTILGGRPKRGKSWLMLQAGCTLAVGGKFLERDLHLGKVLYYALEDRPKRLKDRTEKLGIPDYALIEYELTVKPLHLGGMAAVEQAVRYGNYSMIIIDTIRRALPGKDFTKDGALFDDILSQLQSLAQQTHIAIVAILHTRKSSAGFDPDPVDDVLGSTGLTAAADCVLALYTEQGKKGATLKGRGRDLDDIDLALQFDPLTSAWQSLGETSQVRISEEEEEIILALKDLGKSKVSRIAKEIHKDRSNTSRRCAALWVKGKINKDEIEGTTHYYVRTQATQAAKDTQPTPATQAPQAAQIALPV